MEAALAAARLGDPIEHSNAMLGFAIGAVAGLAIGVAVLGAVVAAPFTGGLSLVAGVAAVAALGGIVAGVGVGATAGGKLGGLMASTTGAIVTGSANVLVNGRPAARAIQDTTTCNKHAPADKRIAQGSGTVFINGMPAARKTDKTECDGPIADGSPDVVVGGGTADYLEIAPEIPAWASRTADLMMVVGGSVALVFGAAGALIAGACATAVFAGGVVTGIVESMAGKAIGGAIGEALYGEKGRIAGETIGELTGIRGIRNALRSTRGHPVDVVTGELIVEHTDFRIPGPLPLIWTRNWLSSSTVDSDLGPGWSHPFDMEAEPLPHLRLVQVRMDDGRIVVFPMPEPDAPTLNTSERLVLHVEGDGYRVASYDGLSHVFARAADGRFRLAAMHDAASNGLAVHRDAVGHISAIADCAGRRFGFSHDEAGRITAIDGPHPDDPRGRQRLVSYGYDADGALCRAVDARGAVTSYRSIAGLIVEERRRGGLTFVFRWDDPAKSRSARCIETWGDDRLYYCRFEYAPDDGLTIVTDDRGGETLYRHNALGLVEAERDPLGHEQQWRWSDAGALLEYRDAEGRSSTFDYDMLNRLVGKSEPGGARTRLAYAELIDASSLSSPSLGLPVFAARPGSDGESFDYDARGQLVAMTDALDRVTRYLRDERGLPLAVRDVLGVVERFGWDGGGMLLWEADARGNRTDYRHDGLGRVVGIRNAGVETRYARDPNGNIVSIERATDGVRVTLEYNEDDQIVRHRDARGRETRWDYAGTSFPIMRRTAEGRTLAYRYDRTLNLVALTNAKGEASTFDFDAAGRMIGETGFDGRRQEYRFDASGLLIERRDASGATSYHRDEAGRVVRQRMSDGVSHGFSWDGNGRLIAATAPDRVVSFAYDRGGQCIGEVQDGVALTHRHDARGRRVASVLPDGRTIETRYDEDDAFTVVLLDGRAVATVLRDHRGREVSRDAGALTLLTEYDPAGRLAGQRATRGSAPVIDRRYAYDPFGQLLEIDDLARGRKRFRYDLVDRLVGMDCTDPEAFVADPAGNVLPIGAGGMEGDAAGDRLRVWGDRRFDYDADGRRVRELRGAGEGRELRYAYDGAGRLREVDERSRRVRKITRFGYDALGRRAWKDAAALPPTAANASSQDAEPALQFSRTIFYWDGDVLLGESVGTPDQRFDPLATLYLHEPDSFRPLALVQRPTPGAPAHVYHYQLDQLGTPQELTNDNGAISWRAHYKAWGAAVRVVETEVANPIRFQGQYADAETGLHYNRHRYYDPGVARYTTPDPIGLQGGLNTHAYVPDPTRLIDPLGLYNGEGQRGLGRYNVFHEHTLRPSEYRLSDPEHFRRANESTHQRMQSDPAFAREMRTKYPGVERHVQPTASGRYRGTSPPNMTWHHGDSPGSINLVDRNDHARFHTIYHPDGTGGRNKWGGGTSCRT